MDVLDFVHHNVHRADVEFAIAVFNMNRNTAYEFDFIPVSDEFFRLVAVQEIPTQHLFEFGIITGKIIAAHIAIAKEKNK